MKLIILILILSSCGSKPDTTVYKNLSCPDLGTDITLKPHEIRVIYDGTYEYYFNGEYVITSGDCVLTTFER